VGSNSVSAFAINPFNGVLTEIAGSPFPLPGTPRSLAVDPGGRFVYVGESGGVSGFTVAFFSGAPALVSGSAFPRGSISVLVVYTCDVMGTGYFYTVNLATGALVVSGRLSGVGGMVAMHPSGRFLYTKGAVLCTPIALCGVIWTFSVDAIAGLAFPIAGQLVP